MKVITKIKIIINLYNIKIKSIKTRNIVILYINLIFSSILSNDSFYIDSYIKLLSNINIFVIY